SFEPKLIGKIATRCVYQEINSFTEGFTVPDDRRKPWGTAHAVLCAKDVIKEPFAVINADDFYGRNAFEKAYEFLKNECDEKTYSLIGYQLNKTLSEYGTVSRGVCEVDDNGNLVSITERTKIYKEQNRIVYEDNGQKVLVDLNAKVSMNFWNFHPSVFELIEKQFKQFLTDHIDNPKSEFFIPIVADHFIKNEGGVVKVISTSSQWFGVTYKEDAPVVAKSLNQLINKGDYPQKLW